MISLGPLQVYHRTLKLLFPQCPALLQTASLCASSYYSSIIQPPCSANLYLPATPSPLRVETGDNSKKTTIADIGDAAAAAVMHHYEVVNIIPVKAYEVRNSLGDLIGCLDPGAHKTTRTISF